MLAVKGYYDGTKIQLLEEVHAQKKLQNSLRMIKNLTHFSAPALEGMPYGTCQ